MIVFISQFDLASGTEAGAFEAAARAFVEELGARGLIEGAEPLAARLRHPCMDTDSGRSQGWLLVMRFRDRQQMDAAYAVIERGEEPIATLHRRMYEQVRNAVFTCWEIPDGAG